MIDLHLDHDDVLRVMRAIDHELDRLADTFSPTDDDVADIQALGRLQAIIEAQL